MDGSESNDVDITLATRLTFLDVAGYRSEWRTDIFLATPMASQSELYRPFTPRTKWFFAPHAAASSSAFKIYRKDDPLAEYRFNRTEIGADIGYGFSRFSEIRFRLRARNFGCQAAAGHARSFHRSAAAPGRLASLRCTDHTDDPVIPRKGLSAQSNFRWYDTSPGGTSSFPVWDARVGFLQAHYQTCVAVFDSEGGTTFGSTGTAIRNSSWEDRTG